MKFFSSKHVLGFYQAFRTWSENIPFSAGSRATDRKILRHLVGEPAPVIFDVGANIGSATIFFKKLFPDSQIYGFEPHHETFLDAKRRTRRLERVFLHNLAVGDTVEKRTLFVNTVASTNSFLKMNLESEWTSEQFMVKPAETQEVQVTTLDAFCARENISRIDLLKLDVQGFEPQALRGAENLLGSQSIAAIKIEVTPGDFYEKSTSFLEIEGALFAAGYRLWSIAHLHYGRHGEIRYLDAYYAPVSKADPDP
jgi:FkbM family methyltransferase